MRLFTAIRLPAPVCEWVVAARAVLPADLAGYASWTPAANLHVTLKFFGEVPEAGVARLSGALRGVAVESFTMGLRGLGVLPPGHGAARVIIAELAGQMDVLQRLFDGIELAAQPLGFAREQRRFHPHVTLARLRLPPGASLDVRAPPSPLPPPFFVRHFELIESTLSPSGSTYQTRERFELTDR